MIYSVHQPHYLPYPGYLAKVARSDIFVFLEGVQYVRREWQNRNRVKGPDGPVWLTVPVSGDYHAAIRDMELPRDTSWIRKHSETLRRFYARAEHAEELDGFISILNRPVSRLSELTIATTSFFLDRFAISTPRRTMGDLEPLPNDPNERIIEIGRQLGARVYLAGAGGRNYMDLEQFEAAGIRVEFFDAPEVRYPQLHGPFVHNLGVIDLLANCGSEGFDEYVRPHLSGTTQV